MAVQNQRLPKDNLNHAKITTTTTTTAPPPPSVVTAPSPFAAVTAPANLSMPTNKNFPTMAQAPPTTSTSTSTLAPPAHSNQQQHQSHQQQQQPSNTVTSTQPATNANGGPRVSFNRDVHVKRIGKRSNDSTNFETTNLQPPQHHQQHIPTPAYHQVPADLSAENIHREAALVLAQAKRHKSIAENGDNIPTFRVKTKRSGDSANSSSSIPKKFHSLPSRKKKPPAKPVSRSNSDAAAAKKPPKKPSIFSLFSRKSDSNINQPDRDPRFEDSGGRRLVRSKSDVGSSSYKLKKVLKEPKVPLASLPPGSSSKHLPSQLSPIIENDSRDDCFEEDFVRERRKSEAITDREKHESAINELLARSRSQVEVDGTLVGRIPVSEGIKEKILTLQAKSQENMHSSQLPVQKLPLTKGHTVNGMVKRLSMERFSPPPTISGPAFSYIRPNEGITYAQLELQDEPRVRREFTRSPVHDYRSPVRELREVRDVRDIRSASRDIFTPERELISTTVLNRNPAEDQTDFVTSQRNNYSPTYNAAKGSTTIHIGGSFSPSPWQMLSPRNLSDEDEGLGLETRKFYEEDVLQSKRSKSPAEPPIVPKIRSITPPRENGFHSTERYNTPTRDPNPNDDMGYRRARLESRILTRRFGDTATLERNGYHNRSRENSHERLLEERENANNFQTRPRYALSPEREVRQEAYEANRFHKPEVKEILNKYSPERSHLDIISPSNSNTTTNKIVNASTTAPTSTMEKTSRYKHTKYYDDGHGGVKEVYERETQFDTDGKPHVRETRHRERLDSYSGKPIRAASPLHLESQRLRSDSYSGKVGRESSPIAADHHHHLERQLITTDYEPKSFDSQFTTTDQYRSSPENMKRYEVNGRVSSEDRWHSSLKRDKLQQRSFDKGDSGIENDFRKESFNGDLVNRWRKRTIADDIKSCDSFLRKERRHCEQLRQAAKRSADSYHYRERSIDDGSHYDPHLDKYPPNSSTLRRRDQQSQTPQEGDGKNNTSTLKRTKKLGGFEKVKQLFTGGSGNNTGSSLPDKKDAERKSMSSSTSSSAGTQQTVKSKDKDKYMVKEEEIRSTRYAHRGEHRLNGGVAVVNGGAGSSSSGGGHSIGVGTQTPENMREPK
uniref:Uncharacterized protein n=1 Tax=Stomoxys calcitrans TaxID=35570 RepID=A0A1I8PY99_STOCA